MYVLKIMNNQIMSRGFLGHGPTNDRQSQKKVSVLVCWWVGVFSKQANPPTVQPTNGVVFGGEVQVLDKNNYKIMVKSKGERRDV